MPTPTASSVYDKKRINAAIDKLPEQAERIDHCEDQLFGAGNAGEQLPKQLRQRKQRLEKLQQIKEHLEKSDHSQINATDPDAVFMKTGDGIKTGYKVQMAVDETRQTILAADVTNEPSDTEQLVPMVEQVQRRTGSIGKLTADSGYSSGENLQAMADKCIDAHIPDANYQGRQRGKQDAPGKGLSPRTSFQRDELHDCFICPAGETLAFSHLQKVKGKPALRLYRCRALKSCRLRDRCTKGLGARSITLSVYDDQLRLMRTKLDSAFGKHIYAQCQGIVGQPL